MKLDLLEALLHEFQRSTAAELSVETADYRLRARRGSAPLRNSDPPAAPVPAAAAPATEAVRSALVGAFRVADPALQTGDRVREGQILGYVDTLRVLTPVTAPGAGLIAEILIQDGYPVEYGQELFRLQLEPEVGAAAEEA